MRTLIRLLLAGGIITAVHGRLLDVPGMFSTIQEGINAADRGDVVRVAPGTYKEHIEIKDGVILRGAGVDRTVIEGTGVRPVIQLFGNSTLTEVTVTSKYEYAGYGVYCTRANPVIKNTKVEKQRWGIGCFLAAPRILDNVVSHNRLEGLHCVASYPTVIGNKVFSNGEGIYCCFCFSTVIKENEVSDNRYTGVYCMQSSPSIIRNTIAGNGYVNVLCNELATPVIKHNSIYNAKYYNLELYKNARVVDARHNYWGAGTKHKIKEKVWDGSDQKDLGTVKLYPWHGTESAALNAPLSAAVPDMDARSSE